MDHLHGKLVLALDTTLIWIGLVTSCRQTGSGSDAGYEVSLSDACVIGTYKASDIVDKFAVEVPPRGVFDRPRVPESYLPYVETLMVCTEKVRRAYERETRST